VDPSPLIRKLLGKDSRVRKNKSIGPEGISAESLEQGLETMIPYLTQILDVSVNNGTLLADCRRVMVFPDHNGVIDL
jgi:hypothetical protein